MSYATSFLKKLRTLGQERGYWGGKGTKLYHFLDIDPTSLHLLSKSKRIMPLNPNEKVVSFTRNPNARLPGLETRKGYNLLRLEFDRTKIPELQAYNYLKLRKKTIQAPEYEERTIHSINLSRANELFINRKKYKELVKKIKSRKPGGFGLATTEYLKPAIRALSKSMKEEGVAVKLGNLGFKKKKEPSPLRGVAIGGITGLGATGATYPLDVYITNRQAGTLSDLKKAITEKGYIQPLYSGISAKLLKNVGAAAITFGLYEFLRNKL